MKNISIIYRREIKLLFSSLAGWIFLALNIAAVGICAVWLCFKNGNPSYQYVPETASLILCFTVPLLHAMTVGAEWKRGESAMLLRYVSPFSVTVGKYLAELTLFSVPSVIAAIFPLILLPFGVASLTAAYISVITYVLVGMALFSLSFFIVSLIKLPVVGGIVALVVSLLLNVVSNIAKVIGVGQELPFVLTAVVLTALIAAITFTYLDNAVIPVALTLICSVTVLILAVSGTASTLLRPILQLLSPQYAFYENIYGTVSVRGIIQPILFLAVFLGFTVLNHANYNKKLTVSFNKNGKVGE